MLDLEQIIYADVLFLIDVSMDFFALYITAFLLKLRFRSGNAILAAAIGAVYSVLTVILRGESLLFAIGISALMCFVAFLGNGLFVMLKALISFYIVSMLLGGAMTLIFNFFNSVSGSSKDVLIYGEVNTVSGNMPVAVFAIGLIAIFVVTKIAFKILNRSPSRTPRSCKITLFGRTAELTVTEDSGNTLVEPISGEPIIFLSESAIRRLADEECISALKMGKSFYDGKYQNRFRIVIYKTVSGSDLCACTKPESVVIEHKQCSAWIAIGKNLRVGESDGIVPYSLLV